MLQIAEVLLDVANRRLNRSYHYLIPGNMIVDIGSRVLVPLQQRQVQGVVIDLAEKIPEDLNAAKLRSVSAVLDHQFTVPQEMIELAKWLAQTTICSVAQCMHTVWPPLKGKMEEQVALEANLQDGDIQAMQWLDEEAFRAIQVLARARQKRLGIKVLQKRANLTEAGLERLLRAGWIRKESHFISRWNSTELSCDGQLSSKDGDEEVDTGFALTEEQKQAVNSILSALAGEKGQTLLLHGVTGSGKTEVYKQVIREVLTAGGDAILLVPEISLTSQTAGIFQECFGDQVAVLHSGLTAKSKGEIWKQILSGRKHLVIGARSAVFAPLPHLKLIILDEEHDGAYKQEENPKYHAREVARKRMERRGGVVVLGSATPSLEAYAAAQNGKIILAEMRSRISSSGLPPVKVIDMREELLNGNRSVFSLALQNSLRERIERGEQTMIFLNRRGYSTFVVCRECGFVVECPHCAVSMTYHAAEQVMRCHYCNHEEGVPHRCPQCSSKYIRFFGQGTQRIEEELGGLLPGVPILRMDGDSTRSADAHRSILEQFRRQEGAVLVGTQMMAKGLDFPNVTLVGVVAADQMLNMPDFRARERAFQLLTQVAGRAGRSVKAGEVIFQTYAPKDRAILRAMEHDYKGFFWDEIAYRKERLYPPFTHVIRVLIMHEKEERSIKGAHELAAIVANSLKKRLEYNDGAEAKLVIDLLGPAPAILSRLKNLFRWQISVKGRNQDELRSLLNESVNSFYQRGESNGIILNIEVDPLAN